MALCN